MQYYVYLFTSKNKSVLYTGVTNNLERGFGKTTRVNIFTAWHEVHYLLHFESFPNINDAIAREKEIKGRRREKKIALI